MRYVKPTPAQAQTIDELRRLGLHASRPFVSELGGVPDQDKSLTIRNSYTRREQTWSIDEQGRIMP